VRPVLSIAGIIAPLQNVALSSALSEPVDSVPVQEGQRVQSGQTLAVLDTRDLSANLEADERTVASDRAKIDQTRYQASLAIGQGGDQVTSARAALSQARQTLIQDQSNLIRDRQLVAQGYISQQALDQQATLVSNDQSAARSSQASLASALTNERVNGTGSQGLQAANVAAAVADEQSAQAQADQLRAQIAKAVIVSPVAGVIVNRNLNPGEYPGSRTIFTIQEDDSVYVMLNASSADVFHIPNQSAVAVLPSGSSTPLHGRVVAVLGQVAPGSTNFTVKVLISNVNGSLPAGVPVTGTISLAATHGIGIPTSAFLDDSRTSVMAVVNGAAHILKVHSLVDDGRTAIVTGVDAGTSVVTNGQLDLTEGQAIGNSSGQARTGGGSATNTP
jgi:multidrug resistance efflux pump